MTIRHSRILPGSGRSRVGSGPEVSSLDALQPWRGQWEGPVPPDSAPHSQGGREASDSSLPADTRRREWCPQDRGPEIIVQLSISYRRFEDPGSSPFSPLSPLAPALGPVSGLPLGNQMQII